VSVLCAGLEAQLLGIVVRKERPELEEQKDSLVINIAAGKKKLQELEDEILRYVAKDFHSARSQITGSSYFTQYDNVAGACHGQFLPSLISN